MKKSLILEVVDCPPDLNPKILAALNAASAVRPIDDHWRDKARGQLLAAFPHAEIYRGGHHVALHVAGPMPAGCLESSPCLGRIVETRQAKEAA